MSQLMTGKQALLETLKAEGVEYIFGNPGTSEGPIIDLLGDYPEFRYILTLQESVAVGMGEAYAGRPGGLPSSAFTWIAGWQTASPLMLDALNTGTPIVVTSANYDARKVNESIIDLAQLVRPVTKWAVGLTLPDQIPSAMRRAFNEANSHLKGPVYVGFTSNAPEGMAEMNIVRPPAPCMTHRIPAWMASPRLHHCCRTPAGPSCWWATGWPKTTHWIGGETGRADGLAGVPSRGAEVAFPTTHEQFLGNLSLRVSDQRAILQHVDLVLAVGTDPFEELFYWGDVILPLDARLVHIGPSPGASAAPNPLTLASWAIAPARFPT